MTQQTPKTYHLHLIKRIFFKMQKSCKTAQQCILTDLHNSYPAVSRSKFIWLVALFEKLMDYGPFP